MLHEQMLFNVTEVETCHAALNLYTSDSHIQLHHYYICGDDHNNRCQWQQVFGNKLILVTSLSRSATGAFYHSLTPILLMCLCLAVTQPPPTSPRSWSCYHSAHKTVALFLILCFF